MNILGYEFNEINYYAGKQEPATRCVNGTWRVLFKYNDLYDQKGWATEEEAIENVREYLYTRICEFSSVEASFKDYPGEQLYLSFGRRIDTFSGAESLFSGFSDLLNEMRMSLNRLTYAGSTLQRGKYSLHCQGYHVGSMFPPTLNVREPALRPTKEKVIRAILDDYKQDHKREMMYGSLGASMCAELEKML